MATNELSREGTPIRHAKRLLVRILDYLAAEQPQSLYGEFPRSPTTYEDGFRQLTYKTFANAVNGIAWWLHRNLGPGKGFETLAYIGPNDIRYPALVLGSNKAGYKILLASPRNSVAAQWHLFKALDCRVMLTPSARPAPVLAILGAQEHELRVLEIPTVDDLLEKEYPAFEYKKTFEEARRDPFVALHTSGSTGLPKPIIWTQDYVSSLGKQVQLDPPPGYENNDCLYQGNRVFIFFPPFHAAYLAHTLINALTNQTRVILPLQAAIPSAQGLSDGLKRTKADVAFVVPLMVEQMSKEPPLLNHISESLDVIVYTGGDLPQAIGDAVSARIKLVNFYGATEAGSVSLLRPEGAWVKEDWKYVIVHPEVGMDFRHFAGQMYELYITRFNHVDHQPAFTIFSDLQEYRTGDLWAPHPLKANRWRHCGRADDIIVFLTGEKTNPITMEQYILARSSEINGVLVAGSLRFQASLLIEPSSRKDMSPTERAQLINRLWPFIEEANKDCPAHAKISKSHILFTNPKKPMVRTPKGTVQRRGTLEAYSKELDDLYTDAEDIVVPDRQVERLNTIDSAVVADFLRRAILEISQLEISEDENMFVRGLDSLQALLLTRNLRSALSIKISVTLVYANPSILLLTRAIQEFAEQEQTSASLKENARREEISQTLASYQSLVNRVSPQRNHANERRARSSRQTILLTGSTGALGSYLLDVLRADASVSHIFCLNRSLDGSTTQQERNTARGLSIDFSDRVTFIRADFSQPNLDLSPATYDNLLKNVTTIIHNAWPVNFNLSLSSFAPQFLGLTNLINFAASAHISSTLFYISSESSVHSLSTPALELIPERVVEDHSAPIAIGYSESKYLSERLISHAAQALDIDTRIARVGQIAGPVNGGGVWNKSEWLPSLVISSFHLQAIPSSLPPGLNTIDWVPIDHLAKILVELALSETEMNGHDESDSALNGRQATVSVTHPLNLHPVSWEIILPTITSRLATIDSTKHIETVPFQTWVRKVREDLEATSSRVHPKDGELERLLEANPSAKLLDFFQEQIEAREKKGFDTRSAQRMSKELRALGPIRQAWMEKWIRAWLE